MQFQAPVQAGNYNMELIVRCDSYVGVDYNERIWYAKRVAHFCAAVVTRHTAPLPPNSIKVNKRVEPVHEHGPNCAHGHSHGEHDHAEDDVEDELAEIDGLDGEEESDADVDDVLESVRRMKLGAGAGAGSSTKRSRRLEKQRALQVRCADCNKYLAAWR